MKAAPVGESLYIKYFDQLVQKIESYKRTPHYPTGRDRDSSLEHYIKQPYCAGELPATTSKPSPPIVGEPAPYLPHPSPTTILPIKQALERKTLQSMYTSGKRHSIKLRAIKQELDLEKEPIKKTSMPSIQPKRVAGITLQSPGHPRSSPGPVSCSTPPRKSRVETTTPVHKQLKVEPFLRPPSPAPITSEDIFFPSYKWSVEPDSSVGQAHAGGPNLAMPPLRALAQSILESDAVGLDVCPRDKALQQVALHDHADWLGLEAECRAKGYHVTQTLERGCKQDFCKLLLASNKGNNRFPMVELTAYRRPRVSVAHSHMAELAKLTEQEPRLSKHVQTLKPHRHLAMLLHRFESAKWTIQVSEYWAWPSVLDLLNAGQKCRGLREDATRTIVRQVCQALDYLHKHRLVHGDLNCSNILVSTQLQVKLTGYGPCCRRLQTQREPKSSPTSQSCASAYTPPEINFMDGRWTQHSDLWCLGVCVVHMRHGSIPQDLKPHALKVYRARNMVKQHRGGKDDSYQQNLLINVLLQWNPTSRPPVERVLKHAWFDSHKWTNQVYATKARTFRTDGRTFPLPHRIKRRSPCVGDTVTNWNSHEQDGEQDEDTPPVSSSMATSPTTQGATGHRKSRDTSSVSAPSSGDTSLVDVTSEPDWST